MTLDATMHVASCTKLVTAIACLQLVEMGKLSLDDPKDVENYAPEVTNVKIVYRENEIFKFRAPAKKITLRMLLNHTSGYGLAVLPPL